MEYITHHGRDGQTWGVRNGPPYPLTIEAKTRAGYIGKRKAKREAKKEEKERSAKIKLAKEEKAKEEALAKKKSHILEKPNPKEVYEERYIFTEKELKELYSKLQLYDNISKLKPKEKTRMDRVKDVSNVIAEIEKSTQNAGKAILNGAKTWNSFVNMGKDFGWFELKTVDINKLSSFGENKKNNS